MNPIDSIVAVNHKQGKVLLLFQAKQEERTIFELTPEAALGLADALKDHAEDCQMDDWMEKPQVGN